MRRKRNNQSHERQKGHNKEETRGNAQKDQQELQSNNGEFKGKLEKLQDETQEYMYNQSSKFSSIARNLTLGILGTIWVLTYSEGKCTIPNSWLLGTLISSLGFMMCDAVHYFLDTISYHKELSAMDSYKTMSDINGIHEPFMDKVFNRSHYFFLCKSIILAISCTLFLLGMWYIYHPQTNN